MTLYTDKIISIIDYNKTMKLITSNKKVVLLMLLIIFYIAIRSIHFENYLNFSSEQASFSLEALRIWRAKSIEFIGPPISLRMGARYLFQGSITYYFMIPFLIFGKLDPVNSSYLFMIFGAFSVIPLFYGTRLLTNEKVAIIMVILFSFFPLYIDYSRFFWNPTAQFILTPYLVLLLGIYEKYNKRLMLILIGMMMGLLLLFHYQFALTIVGVLFYYLFFKKISLLKFANIFIGLLIGVSPMIIFELRNNFYNTQTLLLFTQNKSQVFEDKFSFVYTMHYYLSGSLFLFTIILYKLRKLLNTALIGLFILIIVIFSLIKYSKLPSHGFGMAKDWNIMMEKKTYKIIKQQNITNYNIVNLGYDTVSTVQKYLHEVDGKSFNYNDYYQNKYLYVISEEEEFMGNPAYEVNTFKPSVVVDKWPINTRYKLYLLRKI